MRFYDTSALLKGAILENGEYVSPTVLSELENITSSANKDASVKFMAREALRKLRTVNYKVSLFTVKDRERIMKKYPFLVQNNDTLIICDAILMLTLGKQVTLVTNDMLMFYFASNCISEINAEFFQPVDNNSALWNGWRAFSPTIPQIITLAANPTINILEAKTNEYCSIYEDNVLTQILFWNGVAYRQIGINSIPDAGPIVNRSHKIVPRNPEQQMAFDLLLNKDIKIKLLLGGFGSGKTMAMIAHALEFLDRGCFKKIVFVRNNVEVKDTEKLGALPGEATSKLLPFLMPIADHCGGVEVLYEMIEVGMIEPIHLGFMRGRDIRDTIIFCDECENLTVEQIQLLIGRVAEGSELWLAGDLRQVDHRIFQENSGLRALVQGLEGEELFGMVKLLKSERSATARLADRLD